MEEGRLLSVTYLHQLLKEFRDGYERGRECSLIALSSLSPLSIPFGRFVDVVRIVEREKGCEGEIHYYVWSTAFNTAIEEVWELNYVQPLTPYKLTNRVTRVKNKKRETQLGSERKVTVI